MNKPLPSSVDGSGERLKRFYIDCRIDSGRYFPGSNFGFGGAVVSDQGGVFGQVCRYCVRSRDWSANSRNSESIRDTVRLAGHFRRRNTRVEKSVGFGLGYHNALPVPTVLHWKKLMGQE